VTSTYLPGKSSKNALSGTEKQKIGDTLLNLKSAKSRLGYRPKGAAEICRYSTSLKNKFQIKNKVLKKPKVQPKAPRYKKYHL